MSPERGRSITAGAERGAGEGARRRRRGPTLDGQGRRRAGGRCTGRSYTPAAARPGPAPVLRFGPGRCRCLSSFLHCSGTVSGRRRPPRPPVRRPSPLRPKIPQGWAPAGRDPVPGRDSFVRVWLTQFASPSVRRFPGKGQFFSYRSRERVDRPPFGLIFANNSAGRRQTPAASRSIDLGSFSHFASSCCVEF